jgi:transcriptional regulator with XRE-family HTH domain
MTHKPLKGLKALRGDTPQREIGALIGVTQSQLNKFETGAVRLDLHRAAVLAKHFGVSIDMLL